MIVVWARFRFQLGVAVGLALALLLSQLSALLLREPNTTQAPRHSREDTQGFRQASLEIAFDLRWLRLDRAGVSSWLDCVCSIINSIRMRLSAGKPRASPRPPTSLSFQH